MLVRGSRRVLTFVGPLVVLTLLLILFFSDELKTYSIIPSTGLTGTNAAQESKDVVEDPTAKPGKNNPLNKYHVVDTREIFSVSTPDRKYFPIDFGPYVALNPNIVPHPILNDTWFIAAQRAQDPGHTSVWNLEIACKAQFKGTTLSCIEPAMSLTIANTPGDNCAGDGVGIMAFSIGPHDARVFYGPKTPYTIFGSNSEHACFGLWIEDFRLLVDWGTMEGMRAGPFAIAKEIQRPGKYGFMEKNWFLFFDMEDKMYVHHDVAPKRVFAKLSEDGSVGKDLAPKAASTDDKCMATYMPKVGGEADSIHQATNSLSITNCKRSDPNCVVDESNTFIVTIFQYKQYHTFHADYYPYVMAFRRAAPFAVHGISKKPFWMHGREHAQLDKKGTVAVIEGESVTRPLNQNEMFYITSMSWKTHGQTYHGYIDDVIILAFGIEDRKTAGMDILAGDLLDDLGLCAEL